MMTVTCAMVLKTLKLDNGVLTAHFVDSVTAQEIFITGSAIEPGGVLDLASFAHPHNNQITIAEL